MICSFFPWSLFRGGSVAVRRAAGTPVSVGRQVGERVPLAYLVAVQAAAHRRLVVRVLPTDRDHPVGAGVVRGLDGGDGDVLHHGRFLLSLVGAPCPDELIKPWLG